MSIPSQLTSSSLNVALALTKECNLCNESSTLLAKSILTSQASIAENRGILLEKTDTVPYQLLLSRNAIFPIRLENFIAKGSFSKVFKVSMITTRSHQLGPDDLDPGDITPIALKIWEGKNGSSPTYSPEKRELQQFSSPKKRGIDNFLATFNIPSYAGYSVHKLFDFSLDRAHFENYAPSVQIILAILIPSIQGLCSMHDRNGLHRDIKGGNILAIITQDEIIGALTDFSFITHEHYELHKTFGTPEYLDPQIFGTIENTLLNQKMRKGLQTKASDIYAFGMTLYIDVLCKFLFLQSRDSVNHHGVVDLMKKISYQVIKGPFDDKMLQEYGKKHPYRVIFRPQSTSHPELIKIYPPLNELRPNLIKAWNMLNDCLTPSEIIGLCMLSSLSCDMQTPDLQKRPTVHQVKKEFNSIETYLEDNKSWEESSSESNSPPRVKRKLDFDSESIEETRSPSLEG